MGSSLETARRASAQAPVRSGSGDRAHHPV